MGRQRESGVLRAVASWLGLGWAGWETGRLAGRSVYVYSTDRRDQGKRNCPDRGNRQGSRWQALSNGQTGSVIAVKKKDGRTEDRGRRADVHVLGGGRNALTRSDSSKNDVEKKVWQPLGFGDKGRSEALKRLKVEGSRPDCRCLRSAGATVAMSRPRLHAQLGFLALGVFFLRCPLWGVGLSGPLHSAPSVPAMPTPPLLASCPAVITPH